ncbi:MAG: XrtA/PEP-CTERM system-associated ATPase [Burkholderiales bacterium]
MYEAYFGLTGKPFQLNPDPSFYFASRGHQRAFAYLEYGLYQNEGFIVITGEIGAGKTTILRNLLSQLDPTKVVAAQIVSTQLDADDLLRAVGAAFGLPVRDLDKAMLLASLEAFLCQLATERKRALLVVDEAQNLTPRAMEELRMLSNFQLGDQALLQSFLVGQPELRDTMHGPQMQQLRQRVIASYHLGPMDAGDTRGYVEHRLRHVGWKDDPAISDAAHDAIYALTGGLPRRINTLCNRLLLAAFLGEKHAIDKEDVEQIAGEIREEIGGGEFGGPVAHDLGRATARGAAGLGTLADPRLHRMFEHVDERMDRLERTVAAAVDLLHRLLHPDKAPPPDEPEDSARS